jgi:hypothetical protein
VTIHPPRSSSPSLLVVARGVAGVRDGLVAKWTAWLAGRQPGGTSLDADSTERMVRIIADLLVEMAGPLRREARDTWYAATELYGRLAAVRGLSAGEVVEELQRLRELLILELAEFFVALPARQQLPTVLRINRVLDSAVSNAVVGYTDALVASMFSREGVPVPTTDSIQQMIAQLEGIEAEVKVLAERSPR